MVHPPQVVKAPALDTGSCRNASRSKWSVTVNIVIDKDGKPQHATITTTSGDACVDAQALRTAAGYVFTPAMEAGKAVSSEMKIIMNGP